MVTDKISSVPGSLACLGSWSGREVSMEEAVDKGMTGSFHRVPSQDTPCTNSTVSSFTNLDGKHFLEEDGSMDDEELLAGVRQLSKEDTSSGLVRELRRQLALAIPMTGSYFLQNLVMLTSVSFVGHLGKKELAAAAIASSMAAVTGTATMTGLAGGVETFCGQAYGAGQLQSMWIYLQRGMLLLLAITAALSVFWLHLEWVLLGLGQERELAAMAGDYMLLLIPGMFAQALLQPITRFLQAQGITMPLTATSAAVLAVHIPANYVFVYTLGMGYVGAALAASVTVSVNVAILIVYVMRSKEYADTWPGWDLRVACRGMPEFLHLAGASTIMTCLEYWIFEFLVLAAGWLPRPELQIAVLSCCLNILSLSFQVPNGISAAVSTRVSNELGAGRPNAAQTAALASMMLTAVEGSLQGWAVITFRDKVGYFFSSDPEIVEHIASLMVVQAGLTFMDGIQAVLCGVIRGCGRQHAGVVVNLAAYYLLALPAAWLLAFHWQLNALGLWIGIGFGLAAQSISLAAITFFTDWHALAETAAERVGASKGKSTMLEEI